MRRSSNPIRVLIADDSPVFRHFLKKCLAKMGDVEVAGEARDGAQALERMGELRPDVVTLDMTMPRMNGMETLKAMRSRFPDIPAIVLTSADEDEAALTMEALEAGAFEFVLKPGHGESGERRLIELLHPRLREAAKVARARGVSARRMPRQRPASARPQAAAPKPPSGFRPDILAIGASTGGPSALHTLLSALPEDFPLPVVLTQHMPANFLVSLAERLDRETRLSACVAEDGMPLEAGRIHIAPGGRHLEIVRTAAGLACRLSDAPSEHHCKPAVDPMFRSLAALSGLKVLAVVLTGMGADGAAGALTIREAGGHVIAQDEASSVVWGMPGATVKLGAAHEVLPLADIAPTITAICVSNAPRRPPTRGKGGHHASAAV